jgi:hypothetical protein
MNSVMVSFHMVFPFETLVIPAQAGIQPTGETLVIPA